MNQYLTKIKKNYLNHGIFRGLGAGLLLGLIPAEVATFMPMKNSTLIAIGVLIAVVFFVTVISIFLRNNKYKQLIQRVSDLEATGSLLENETFEAIGKELLVGENWLVYHKSPEYRFWTKSDIQKVRRINDYVIEITDANQKRDRIRVNSNLDLENVINQWLGKEADNLTLGQI